MRWKPIEDRDIPNWIAAPIAIPFLVVLLPLLLLVWLEQQKRRRFGPTENWSRWFAWYPVRSDCGFGKAVWLEWVERRDWYGTTHHRTIEEALSA